MYKNIINFNLNQLCRQLKRKNIQFSRNGNTISILPLSVHASENYIGVYQNREQILFKEDAVLCNLFVSIIKNANNNIEVEYKGDRVSVFNINVLISKNSITVLQNGKFL